MAAARGWGAFAALGTAIGFADKYSEGMQGKPMSWTDIGPQVVPKIAGRLHYGYNQQKQMEGNWAVAEHRAKLIAETPPFTTNYPSRPVIKW